MLIWFVALFITVAAALFTAKELRQKEQISEAITTLKPSENPYHFSVNKNMWIPEEYDDTKYIFKEVPHTNPGFRNNFRGIPEVTFLYTTDSISRIELITSSHGGSKKEALIKAKGIGYNLRVEGNHVLLDPLFTIPAKEKFRAQDVTIRISLAEGTVFTVCDHLEDIAYPWFLDEDKTYIAKNNEIKKMP